MKTEVKKLGASAFSLSVFTSLTIMFVRGMAFLGLPFVAAIPVEALIVLCIPCQVQIQLCLPDFAVT